MKIEKRHINEPLNLSDMYALLDTIEGVQTVKNIKVSKENIPAATQLFTPDWIVRYMVENSLGRLWLEGHPNPELQAKWKYYVPEAKQEPEVENKLQQLQKEYAQLQPENLTLLEMQIPVLIKELSAPQILKIA